jgi:hypothetical protein
VKFGFANQMALVRILANRSIAFGVVEDRRTE